MFSVHVAYRTHIGERHALSLSLDGHLHLASDHRTRILLDGSEVVVWAMDLFKAPY